MTPTPPKGPIDWEPPRAKTNEEVQESWHKAKNHPVPIAPKKDSL